MKKLLLLFFLFVCIKGFTQTIEPTTKKEYNFIVSEYQVRQKQNMPETKKGYEFKLFKTFIRETRKVTIKELFREGEESPCAIMIKYHKEGKQPHYICMPTYDADLSLWDKFYQDTAPVEKKKNDNKFSIIIYALAQYAMRQNKQQN